MNDDPNDLDPGTAFDEQLPEAPAGPEGSPLSAPGAPASGAVYRVRDPRRRAQGQLGRRRPGAD